MKKATIPLVGTALSGVAAAEAARAAAVAPRFGTSSSLTVRALELALAGSDLTDGGEMDRSMTMTGDVAVRLPSSVCTAVVNPAIAVDATSVSLCRSRRDPPGTRSRSRAGFRISDCRALR